MSWSPGLWEGPGSGNSLASESQGGRVPRLGGHAPPPMNTDRAGGRGASFASPGVPERGGRRPGEEAPTQ